MAEQLVCVCVLEGGRDVTTIKAACDAARTLSSLPVVSSCEIGLLWSTALTSSLWSSRTQPGASHSGWQREAGIRTELAFRGGMLEVIVDHQRALLRSQSGPGAGVALSVTPSSYHTHFVSQLFQHSASSSPSLAFV